MALGARGDHGAHATAHSRSVAAVIPLTGLALLLAAYFLRITPPLPSDIVFAITAVIITVFLSARPAFQRLSLKLKVAFVTGGYVLGWYVLAVITDSARSSTIVWITCMLLLLIAVVHLGHKPAGFVARLLDESRSLDTLYTGTRVLPFSAALRNELDAEMARARRFDHPLSIAVVRPSLPDDGDVSRLPWIDRRIVRRALRSRLAALALQTVRRFDVVAVDDLSDDVLVICPEAGADDVAAWVDRLHAAVQDDPGAGFTFGTACFPEDALTLDDLAAVARSRLERARAPDVVSTVTYEAGKSS